MKKLIRIKKRKRGKITALLCNINPSIWQSIFNNFLADKEETKVIEVQKDDENRLYGMFK